MDGLRKIGGLIGNQGLVLFLVWVMGWIQDLRGFACERSFDYKTPKPMGDFGFGMAGLFNKCDQLLIGIFGVAAQIPALARNSAKVVVRAKTLSQFFRMVMSFCCLILLCKVVLTLPGNRSSRHISKQCRQFSYFALVMAS